MKGFTHFISATAIGSCVPGAAAYAVEHTSYILVLGGVFGLLPDTLDFKLNRFIHRYDERFDPGQNPDPDAIAAAVARNIERARTENRTVNLHLHTIKVGADMWQEYTIQFDEAAQDIVVEIGPVVNTGKVPVPNSEPKEHRTGRAHVSCTFKQDYSILTRVNIFSGPSFGFKPDKGRVDIHFIPWHRGWSHSLTLAVLLGAVTWAVVSLIHRTWLYPGWMFGLVIALGFSTHVLEDQFGHLGSNLFYPLTRERTSGFKTMHANDALPNFMTVWLSLALLFWNLYRVTPDTFFPVYINGLSYLLYVVVIPVALMIVGSILVKSSMKAPAEPPEEEEEEIML
jgi:membrane-bound metal-dependent hydrolase YbcI (DUF457 family)